MIPENLTPLVWIKETSATYNNILKLSYEIPYNKENPLVLQQLDNDNVVTSTIVIPKECILGLSIELLKFIKD